MNLYKTCLAPAIVLTLVSAPAFAQHRGGESSRSSRRGAARDSSSRSISAGRSFAAPRGLAAPHGVQAPRSRYALRSYAATRVLGSRLPVRAFSRPYYTFRPRTRLAFGLIVGYPVPYAYYYASAYADPYAYAYPYASVSPSPYSYVTPYAAPPPGAIGDDGGLSFDIAPADAQVLIDGQVVGVVGNFSPTLQPLTLPPGHHHLEIRAPGFRSVVDDVDVVPGEIIPFHGNLQR